MIFNKILKLADAHVASMIKDRLIMSRKRYIAKYSFLSGFEAAIMLYDKDNNAIVHREEKRQKDAHKS